MIPTKGEGGRWLLDMSDLPNLAGMLIAKNSIIRLPLTVELVSALSSVPDFLPSPLPDLSEDWFEPENDPKGFLSHVVSFLFTFSLLADGDILLGCLPQLNLRDSGNWALCPLVIGLFTVIDPLLGSIWIPSNSASVDSCLVRSLTEWDLLIGVDALELSLVESSTLFSLIVFWFSCTVISILFLLHPSGTDKHVMSSSSVTTSEASSSLGSVVTPTSSTMLTVLPASMLIEINGWIKVDPSGVCSSASHTSYDYKMGMTKYHDIRKINPKSSCDAIRRAEGWLRFTCLSMSSSKTSSMSVISVVTSMNSRLAFRSSPVNGSSSLCKVKVKLKFFHLFYCQYQAHCHVLINGGLHLNS